MAARSELGISPVLLQAIAQTLTSSATSSQSTSRDTTVTCGPQSTVKGDVCNAQAINSSNCNISGLYSSQAGLLSCDTNKTVNVTTFSKVTSMDGNSVQSNSNSVSQLLQDLNEPVASLLPQTKSNTVSVTSLSSSSKFPSQQQLTQAGLSMLGISSSASEQTTISVDGQSNIEALTLSASNADIQQLSQPMVSDNGLSNEDMANFLLKQEPSEDNAAMADQPQAVPSVSSMLSALATQHAQESLSKKTDGNTGGDSPSKGQKPPQHLIVVSGTSDTSIATVALTSATSSPPISLSNHNAKSSTTTSSSNSSQPQLIIYRYVNSEGQEVNLPLASDSSGQQIVFNSGALHDSGAGTNQAGATSSTSNMESPVGNYRVFVQTQGESDVSGVVPINDAQNIQEGMSHPCPVCGDKVSGYHYGIFTCESCKGFFKRTVQNKKTFVCPKSSDCTINSVNRKKCPACRFKRCLAMGMKLEAIRQDRTRGGRSSYEGCSHHMKPRVSPLDKKIKRVTGRLPGEPAEGEEEDDGPGSHRNLVAILNHNTHKQTSPNAGVPHIPELLRDIMNLEPLLSDDDLPADTITESPFPEQAVYSYMMQLAELRLYKLVRWARNLPQFGAISTDDQILLLQNCWSELMALSLCWRSIDTPNQISISSSHHITAAWAHHLGFEDVVIQLINITDCFRRLFMDQFEYVALKVLLLITPDVKGLKEPRKIRDFQDKLLEALLSYTSTHYSNMKHKFGELLLRLPELSRISFLCKDILIKSLPASTSSCGLLVELLKGDTKGEGDQGGLRF